MKKVFLSITALTFGASVAFAQVEDADVTQDPNNDLQIENLSNTVEESGKKIIQLEELPAAVQEAFKESEYKDWEVSEIYEVSDAATAGTESDAGIAPAGEEASYEIRLISKDMKDEIEDSQETMEDIQENAIEADADEVEEANVATETVEVEVPAVVLKYDKEGNLIKENDEVENQAPENLEEY